MLYPDLSLICRFEPYQKRAFFPDNVTFPVVPTRALGLECEIKVVDDFGEGSAHFSVGETSIHELARPV